MTMIFYFLYTSDLSTSKKAFNFPRSSISSRDWPGRLYVWSNEVLKFFLKYRSFDHFNRHSYISVTIVLSYQSTYWKHMIGSQNWKKNNAGYQIWSVRDIYSLIYTNGKLRNFNIIKPLGTVGIWSANLTLSLIFDMLTWWQYMMAINPTWQWFWKVTCGYCFSWC